MSKRGLLLDYSGTAIIKVSEFTVTNKIMGLYRIRVAKTGNSIMAYLIGMLADATGRGMNGLAIANLDSDNNFSNPSSYTEIFDPVKHYTSTTATVNDVQVIDSVNNQYTYAYIACGKGGQLTTLNVTDPANIAFVGKMDITPDFPVFKVLASEDNTRLYVASTNVLHVVDVISQQVLGSVNAGFFDAGDHDMTFYKQGSNKYIWTATHFSVNHVLHSVNVTNDNAPIRDVSHWWISSSDGAVAVPEWNSIYLPTFGGVVRYDVSDETDPVAVDSSYQPANGTTEHICVCWPDMSDKDHAYLLTAPGNGGVQYWAVSKGNPNPASPQKVFEKPQAWGNDPVYQNDVAFYHKAGVCYFLSDLANRKTHAVALQVYNTETQQWRNAIESDDNLKANSHNITVHGDYAFVTCEGGIFIVDLSGLPASVSVTDEVLTDPKGASAVATSPDGAYIFVATDPGAVISYSFNNSTGKVSAPLYTLTGDTIWGATSRARYHEALNKLYVACRGGNLMEVDVADPSSMTLLSVWNNGAYTGEMQDCHIYDFGNGPRILTVKNNEGFAILKPDDGINIETHPVNSKKGYYLFQNWPNPFNNTTEISFYIQRSCVVNLAIYNLAGEKIRTLINKQLTTGRHAVIFDAGMLPSGNYLYTIQAGKFTQTRNLLLIK